ncbi:hypothetical protein BGZ80_008896 [Entomortierella chlamydospora]|uniref:Transmembrane protein n=1 Tax=Entomortierella chlamydospora TaxID=101097 RepID=A0A9P6T4X6_9FUNG|nr:hypothetical protein BGZ79_003631 [Entomortierella chlamydospora]KAG0024738.1 hypothetical protein BGZ80_008896 [Entomortierella chlamydospora]
MSVLFGRKTAGTKLNTINYARGLVVSLYLVSWAFSFIACQLAQTNNFNTVSCTMSIYTCIILYAISKLIIYLFLMEKVYVVTAVGSTRREFLLYKINLLLMTPYFVIIALMIIFRVAELDNTGECHIGLLKPAALPLILYDMFLSSWLTLLFIRPLMSSTSLLQGPSKGKLRDVARRTLVGAITALVLSSANVFTLVYFQGNERGLICLSSCTADVTLNAITIHWATSRASKSSPTGPGGGAGGGGGGGGGGGRGGGGVGRSSRPGRGVVDNSSSFVTPHLSVPEKHMGALESHITVEAYVEEYHSGSHADLETATSFK